MDAAIVDLGRRAEETWRAAALAREFPSVPFFGLTTLRASEAPALAQCAALDFADVLVEAVDDTRAARLVLRQAFSTRFAVALHEPPRRARALDAAAAAGVAVHRRAGRAGRCARSCSPMRSRSRASI